MRCIVSAQTLFKNLQKLQGVIQANPLSPIIENFLFDIQDRNLAILATDLNTTLTTQMGVEAKGSMRIAVPSRFLLETLKSLGEQPVTLNMDETTYSIAMSTDSGEYQLLGEDPAAFPVLTGPDEVHQQFTMPAHTFLEGLNHTLFAVSTDELRLSMVGVLVEMDTTGVRFAATDGHKLATHSCHIPGPELSGKFILPRKAVQLLRNLLPEISGDIALRFDRSNAYFNFGETELTCRLIDARFPDYKSVIPVGNDYSLTVSRQNLLACLRRTSLYANKSTYLIRVTLSGSELKVVSEDADLSSHAQESIACSWDGPDMSIGFNGRTFIEMLSNLSADQIVVKLNSPNKPGLISPAEPDPSYTVMMLIMPVIMAFYD
ncbi:MAG: DNA polymerase III subunit beta [Sphingomonadales bacterium]|nr:DNA polymerase III subunit beta [Sphingomonadales bacterium]